MNQTFKKIFLNPKIVIGIAIIIALGIGVVSTIVHNTTQADMFAKVTQTATSTDTTSVSLQDLTLAFPIGGRIKSVSVKIGDTVKAGEILASLDAENVIGAINQAKAAYSVAIANYQKVLNGATGSTIDIAKAAVNTAQVNLGEVTKQQTILVENARRTLLNSSLAAETVSNYSGYDSPTVSGTYICSQEGSYTLKTYSSSGGISVAYSGIEQGSILLTDVPRPMGTCGLSLSFDKTKTLLSGIEFIIQIPNKNATNYGLNDNLYQLALQTKNQAIAGAQATVDQANASLTSVITAARPEDVAIAKAQVESTQGALQIAQGAYNNTIITAPVNGKITNVSITAGQIATPNTAAIEMLSQ